MKEKLAMIFVLLLIGCASNPNKYIPKEISGHTRLDPADGISILHPVELEKAGIKKFVTFQGLLEPGLWVEVINAGGVWSFLVQTTYGEILSGDAFLTSVTYWGDWQIQFVFMGPYKDIQGGKILYFNRDAGFAYTPLGKQIEYDPKEFDKNHDYRKSLFDNHGQMISQIDQFWHDYLKDKGLEPPTDLSSMLEISIPSDDWLDYKDKVSRIMPHNYKMGNGEIRCGVLPLEMFKKAAVEIPGFNGVDRYLKRAKVPLIALPLSGIGLLASAGVSLASDAIVAGVDDSWTGSFARAEVLRYRIAPLFRQMVLIYKKLLKNRDERILKQQELINELKFQLFLFKD